MMDAGSVAAWQLDHAWMATTPRSPIAFVEIRSQHSRGSSAGQFGGPDTYVAVQIVPDGATRLTVLRHDVAARRGIAIKYCGEGYSAHRGTRSMLGRAIAKAEAIAAEINAPYVTAERVAAILRGE